MTPAAAEAWSLCLLLERPKSVRGGAGGRGAASPLPRLPFFFLFSSYLLKKKKNFFLNKLSEGELPMGWKGWARPPSRPEAGPRSSPGVCWWPRGALRAGGRGVRPHRDVLAGACGEKAGTGLSGRLGGGECAAGVEKGKSEPTRPPQLARASPA